MVKTRAAAEGVDFGTFQPGNRQSGWNWYCMHCTEDAGRGWRWARGDARKDARTHVGTHQGGDGRG